MEGLRHLGAPFVVLSASVAIASACTSETVRQSPVPAHGTNADAAPTTSGDGGPAGPTEGGGSDAPRAVVFPEIRTGSVPPDGTEPPPPVDDCASLDPKGVQVLASVCPAVLAVDDEWVYVKEVHSPTFESPGHGPTVRIPRCGGEQQQLAADAPGGGVLLSAGGYLYGPGAFSTVDRIAKADGTVTTLDARCARGIAANATHLFVVNGCDGSVLRVSHDATDFETIARGIPTDWIGTLAAATDSFVYFWAGDAILRVPVDGGAVEVALDLNAHNPKLLQAGVDSLYVTTTAYPAGSDDSLVRIPEDPSYSRVSVPSPGTSSVVVDQGFAYLVGGYGIDRVRGGDLGNKTIMGDAPMPTGGVVATHDRLYYCDGDLLVTRRATVAPLPSGALRPSSAATWKAVPSGMMFVNLDADSAGNVYATALEPTLDPAGHDVAYLMKYDSAGQELWRKPLPKFEIWSFAVDSSGSALIEMDDPSDNSTVLSRYATDGSLTWSNAVTLGLAYLGGKGSALATAELRDSNDHLYTEVRAFDASGKEIASTALPGGASLMFDQLFAEAGGTFLASGSVRDSAQLPAGMTGDTDDRFLMQLDASFHQIWYRTFPGASLGVGATFPDGGFMLAGGGTPGADFGAGPVTDAPSAHYIVVARYDSSKHLVWQRMWASVPGAAVAVAGDGSVFATGGTGGLSSVSGTWMRAAPPYVLKLRSDGAFAWAESLSSGDVPFLRVDSTGHVITIGSSGTSSSIGGESIVKFAQ